MQIGKGKQGVLIGEYTGTRAGKQDYNEVLGYIEPACDNPQWILWFTARGDAQLYTKRSYENGCTGAVLGEPVKIKARGSNASS